MLRLSFGQRFHLGLEIYGIADEPFLTGREVLDAGIAGVRAPVEHGDRPLHEVQRRRVLQAQPIQRMFDVHTLVVDRQLCALHCLVDDWEESRFLSRQRDGRCDSVLEHLA